MPHPFAAFYRGKRVLVTGHTEFPCGWLVAWLRLLAAKVSGYGLPPATRPNFFDATLLDRGITSAFGDVRNRNSLADAFAEFQPEIVIHDATQVPAQRSGREPLEAFATNLIGTVNLLEEARLTKSVRAVVVMTGASCYENRDWFWSYREEDVLGGRDPYGASMAGVELASSAYLRSFFQGTRTGIATARTASVLGGGDWRPDELIPDIVRDITSDHLVLVRCGSSIYPQLHVLDALRPCLLLGQRLYESGQAFSGPWNFGPRDADAESIQKIAEKFVELWGRGQLELRSHCDPSPPRPVRLSIRKAEMHLGWTPALGPDEALAWTVAWYRAFYSDPASAWCTTEHQIQQYMKMTG